MVEKFGLSAWVVLDKVDRVPKGEDENHEISMIAVDNFFNLFRLTGVCSKQNLAIIGTLRQDRVENTSVSKQGNDNEDVSWAV